MSPIEKHRPPATAAATANPRSLRPATKTSSAAAPLAPIQRTIAVVRPLPPSPLPPAEATVAETGRQVGEHADAARADRLHERERSQRERGRVEQKAARLQREPEEPAAVVEQQPQRVQRAAHREDWQRGGGVVLAEIRDVGQRCRRQREDEGDDGLEAQGGIAANGLL